MRIQHYTYMLTYLHNISNGQDALSCHCRPLTIHSSLEAEIKLHLLHEALTNLPQPHFSFCSLNSLHSWADAHRFDI